MSAERLIIGKFRYDQYGIMRGSIGGLGYGSVEVISQDADDNRGEPYMRLIADPLGAAYEIGVVYYRENVDRFYYSVRLDSPFIPAPIFATLFYDKHDHGLLNLMWRRTWPPRSNADPKADDTANK